MSKLTIYAKPCLCIYDKKIRTIKAWASMRNIPVEAYRTILDEGWLKESEKYRKDYLCFVVYDEKAYDLDEFVAKCSMTTNNEEIK